MSSAEDWEKNLVATEDLTGNRVGELRSRYPARPRRPLRQLHISTAGGDFGDNPGSGLRPYQGGGRRERADDQHDHSKR